MDSNDSGDSEWETVPSDDEDMDHGSEDSVSIDSNSSESENDDNDSDDESDTAFTGQHSGQEESEEAPESLQEQTPAAKQKPVGAEAGAHKPKEPTKTTTDPVSASAERKRIVPIQPAKSATVTKSVKPTAVKQNVVKFSYDSPKGQIGRPMKNATVVQSSLAGLDEYPSTSAFKQVMPTNASQYAKVVIKGRKPSVCRAFQVKTLRPPHKTTFYALTSASDDERALKSLGVPTGDSAEMQALASASVQQCKLNGKEFSECMQKTSTRVAKAVGWLGPDAPLADQPAIMCQELAAKWLKDAAAKPNPKPQIKAAPQPRQEKGTPKTNLLAASKKRKLQALNDSTVEVKSSSPSKCNQVQATKRFAQEIQNIVGGTITNITISVSLLPSSATP